MRQLFKHSIIILGLLYLPATKTFAQNPVAKKGVLLLQNWDFAQHPLIDLSGEWEIYWKYFLSPPEFRHPSNHIKTHFVVLPQVWNQHKIAGISFSAQGYATYRLRIQLPPQCPPLAIKVPTMGTAYTLYINGKEASSVGKLSKHKVGAVPAYQPRIIVLPTNQPSIELVLQISNFHHRLGGVWFPLSLGTTSMLNSQWQHSAIIAMFLVGSILMMALYHVGLFIIRRRNFSVLYFGLFCFFIALRLITTGNYLITYMLPSFDQWVIHLEYITFYTGGLFFATFIRSIFPKEIRKYPILVFQVVAFIFTFITLTSSIHFFTSISFIYQLLTLVGGLYVFISLIRAHLKQRESATAFLMGWLILFASIVHDILHANNFINSEYIAGFGLFIFIFSQAFLLSSRFASAFQHTQTLSAELEYTNQNLEKIVADRTLSLQEANEELQSLNEFKEAMAGMVVHDLKNPLNAIINLTEQVTIKDAGKQMLDLVTNILDIQKLETAQLTIAQKPLNLQHLIQVALNQVSYLIEAKDLRIYNHCSPKYWVEVDADIIQRVLINLLTNAIKYTPESGEITLDTEQIDQQIKVWVKDNGTGIPADKQTMIFDKFGQVEARQSGVARASGLGLTFCKLAIEAHGGTIGVRSRLGVGAEFWFTLCLSTAQTSAKDNEVPTSSNTPVHKPTAATLELSARDRSILAPFLDEFKQLDVYEISSLRRLIAKIDTQDRQNLQLWLQEITKAIYTCNEAKYRALLQVA